MELQKTLEAYEPPVEAVDEIRDMKFLFMVGIAAAGKDTLQQKILNNSHYEKITTSVTRAPRQNNGIMEEHGREYYFLSRDNAQELLAQGRYIEVALVHGEIYGATIDELHRIYDLGKTAMADVDFQGIEYYTRHFQSTSVVAVMPPSYDEWVRRAKSRYDTQAAFEEAWPERVASARRELGWMLEHDYTYVVNDTVSRAVDYITSLETEGVNPEEQQRGKAIARDILEQLS